MQQRRTGEPIFDKGFDAAGRWAGGAAREQENRWTVGGNRRQAGKGKNAV